MACLSWAALVAWQVARDGGNTGERKAVVGAASGQKSQEWTGGWWLVGTLRKDGSMIFHQNQHTCDFVFRAGLLNFVQK